MDVTTSTTQPKTELQREQEYIKADIRVAEQFAAQTFSSVEGMFAAVMALVSTRSGLKVITAKEQLDTTSERAKMRKELESLLTELESIMHDQTGTLAGIKDLTKRAKATELAYKINYLANELGYSPAVGQVNPANFEPPPEQKFGLVGDTAVIATAYNSPEAEAEAKASATDRVLGYAELRQSGTNKDGFPTYDVYLPGTTGRIQAAAMSLIRDGKTDLAPVATADQFRDLCENIDTYRTRIEKSGSGPERTALAQFDSVFNASYSKQLSAVSPAYCRSVTNGIAPTANLSTIQGAQQRVRGDVTTDGEKINQHSSAVTTEYKKSTDNISLAQDYIQGLGKKMTGIVNNF
jgi:hypothetical protein